MLRKAHLHNVAQIQQLWSMVQLRPTNNVAAVLVLSASIRRRIVKCLAQESRHAPLNGERADIRE